MYVRQLISNGLLTYHRATCRHVRPDATPVDEWELDKAIKQMQEHARQVEFEGRPVLVWVCRMCLRDGRPPRQWPPFRDEW